MVMKKRDEDPNAGFPGVTNPEGSLGPKAPAGPTTNEPDGDASGRPGSATRAKPTTGDAPQSKSDADADPIPQGSIRVKAKKTVLVGGMAYTEGQVFTISEEEFEARKGRDEFEKV